MNARERSAWSAAVARAIRAERAARGWSQDELVTRSGLSKSTLRRLETGERVSDVSQLARLAETFEMDFPELVERVSRRRADILREQENGGGDNTPPAEPPVAL